MTASPMVFVSFSKASSAGLFACVVVELSFAFGEATVAVVISGAAIRVGVIRVFFGRLEGGASKVALWPGSQGGMRGVSAGVFSNRGALDTSLAVGGDWGATVLGTWVCAGP